MYWRASASSMTWVNVSWAEPVAPARTEPLVRICCAAAPTGGAVPTLPASPADADSCITT